MIVKVENTEDDYFLSLKISIDGETVFQAHDGEPEDNTLSRNFNDCFGIAQLLERAWKAGKNGEEFTLTEV